MTDLNVELVSPKNAASILQVSVVTLARWRQQNKGPKYFKLSAKKIMYSKEHIYKWLESNINSS
ncbi:helix-turn-helix transcriptional regulator [Yunchengibacter salinarum]|uniref:helix-turn-helix transcriptional regulator n=1 Tax=Yunchengibacter salinarum TaxID=3133399 RepID=UPI0035B5E682